MVWTFQAVTNSKAKVAGFEFQIQKSRDKNAENPKIPLDNELVESDIQNSTEILNDIENSESVEQEPQEDFRSEPPIPMDIEEVYLVKSKPLDSDDDEVIMIIFKEELIWVDAFDELFLKRLIYCCLLF